MQKKISVRIFLTITIVISVIIAFYINAMFGSGTEAYLAAYQASDNLIVSETARNIATGSPIPFLIKLTGIVGLVITWGTLLIPKQKQEE